MLFSEALVQTLMMGMDGHGPDADIGGVWHGPDVEIGGVWRALM